MTNASTASRSNAIELPAAWLALPERLRKPFWTVRETIEATGLSRATLNRHWADPRSRFPRRRHTGGRVHLNALEVVRFMEG
jgi:predicted DNA-binding transcriptional regulator AlpA